MKNLILIIKSIYTTIFYSLKIIYQAYRNKLSINEMNKLVDSWSYKILTIVNAKIKIFGSKPNFNDGKRYIILCTHSSHYDIPITFQVFKDATIRMMAKKELFQIPFFGKAIKYGGFVSVDRKNRKQAAKDLKYAKQIMEQDSVCLWIAPEGTRSLDGKLQEFQKGGFYLAQQMQAIIIPVVIEGSFNILPAKSYQLQTNQTVKVYIGQEIIHDEKKDREELMKEVKKIMLELPYNFREELKDDN